jgi:hypothetical protein
MVNDVNYDISHVSLIVQRTLMLMQIEVGGVVDPTYYFCCVRPLGPRQSAAQAGHPHTSFHHLIDLRHARSNSAAVTRHRGT